MTPPERDRDDEFAVLLAAYDTQLASGDTMPQHFTMPLSDLPDDLSLRLAAAQDCLLVLKQIWPRAKRGDSRALELASRFRMVRELGRGGFGIVYLAEDMLLGRTVALKVQRPEAIISASLRDRFAREAKAAARLRHPHVAAVYDMGNEGLRFWIATEYCDGDSLAAWIGAQNVETDPLAVAAFMAALADALEYSHQQGVLHRDLKPSNVLLQRNVNTRSLDASAVTTLTAVTPKLIDFGLAKLLESADLETRSGALVGTPAYMAPEQASGQVRQIGPATDIYGLGTILYELITGRPVFRGASDADTLRQVVADEPAAPRRLRPEVPRDLEAICLKCLQKQPAKRYASAGALAADLRRFVRGEPTEARPLTQAQRLVNWARRRPALAGLVAVSMAACVALAVVTFVYVLQLRASWHTADSLRTEAETGAQSARQQEQLASQYMYVSHMKHAYEWLEQGEIRRVEEMLDQYQSGSRLAHLRGFEWYHLKRRLHGEQLSLSGHRGEVYAVTFSPDGCVLASGGQDGTIKLWDPASGHELATIAAHRSCVNAVEYTPDGQVLASASCDHTIKLWHAATHELLATLEGHPDEVHCLAISPDGQLLASGGHDPVALVWDLPTRKVFRSLNADAGVINSLAWRPGSRKLVGAAARQLFIWDLDDDQQMVRHPCFPTSIAISPTRAEIALGESSGAAILTADFSVRTEELSTQFNGGPRSLAFSSDGAWLASGAGDGTIRIWGRRQEASRETLTGHTGSVQSLAFAPRGDLLASASFDGTVKLWKPRRSAIPTQQSAFFLLGQTAASRMVAISPDFRYLAWPSSLHEATVFDMHNGAVYEHVSAAQDPIRGLNFLAAEQPVLFGLPKDAAHLTICDVIPRKFEGDFPLPADPPPNPVESRMPTGAPRDVALSSDGRHLISTDPRNVTILDTSNGEEWCSLPCNLNDSNPVWNGVQPALFFSPDGRMLGIALGREPGCLVDLGAKHYRRHDLTGLCAIANGGQLVAQRPGRVAIVLIDLRSERELGTLQHPSPVTDAAFSPDARTFATGTEDGFVYLWSVATGEAITRFETQVGEILKVQFSPDSRKLVALAFAETAAPDGRQGKIRLFTWEGIDGP